MTPKSIPLIVYICGFVWQILHLYSIFANISLCKTSYMYENINLQYLATVTKGADYSHSHVDYIMTDNERSRITTEALTRVKFGVWFMALWISQYYRIGVVLILGGLQAPKASCALQRSNFARRFLQRCRAFQASVAQVVSLSHVLWDLDFGLWKTPSSEYATRTCKGENYTG